MYEAEATALLRRMIHAAPEERPGEPYDPGWCCEESAVVAALALCCVGVRAEIADGRALFVERDERRILAVTHHWFVLASENGKCTGVFDASATFGPVAGVAFEYAKHSPTLCVSVYTPLPNEAGVYAELQRANKAHAAMYEPKRGRVPTEVVVRWVAETPFGNWLRKTVGSQAGIWGKAALIVAQTLETGKPHNTPNGFNKLSQAELWRWVSQTPNADDFVARKLAAFK